MLLNRQEDDKKIADYIKKTRLQITLKKKTRLQRYSLPAASLIQYNNSLLLAHKIRQRYPKRSTNEFNMVPIFERIACSQSCVFPRPFDTYTTIKSGIERLADAF